MDNNIQNSGSDEEEDDDGGKNFQILSPVLSPLPEKVHAHISLNTQEEVNSKIPKLDLTKAKKI